MKLVLQCAMCGTHHPVGTLACSACRASGVTQLRLMFECESCGRLDINPVCATCPRPASAAVTDPIVLDLDEGLIIAEEVVEDPFALDPGAKDSLDDLPLELDVDEADEKVVVDLSEDEEGSDLGASAFGDDDGDFETEFEDEWEEEDEDFDQDFDESEEDEDGDSSDEEEKEDDYR